ncbi:MAG: catechol 2,3-dioxygenase [Chlamydiales bacterium]|jgi:catechol 2,3-dioxygenase
MTAPKLSGGLDDVHVHVRDRNAAADWYAATLGFERVARYAFWAKDARGPLTIADPPGSIHLALFETDKPTTDTIAFGASGPEFMAWRAHLDARSIATRLADHDLSYSMYFSDPDGNMHEITTYEPDDVRDQLGQSSPGAGC